MPRRKTKKHPRTPSGLAHSRDGCATTRLLRQNIDFDQGVAGCVVFRRHNRGRISPLVLSHSQKRARSPESKPASCLRNCRQRRVAFHWPCPLMLSACSRSRIFDRDFCRALPHAKTTVMADKFLRLSRNHLRLRTQKNLSLNTKNGKFSNNGSPSRQFRRPHSNVGAMR